MTATLKFLLFLGFVGGIGCSASGGNSLSGSIGDPDLEASRYDLGFTDVLIRKGSSSLTVSYIKRVSDELTNIHAEVVINLDAEDQFRTGIEYNFEDIAELSTHRIFTLDGGSVTTDERAFPAVSSDSKVIFYELSEEQGKTIRGEFTIIFRRDQSQGIPDGRTLSGRFTGELILLED